VLFADVPMCALYAESDRVTTDACCLFFRSYCNGEFSRRLVSICQLLYTLNTMAFCYRPISRWTKKRRLDSGYNRAVHAMNSAYCDSDDELDATEIFESTYVTASTPQECTDGDSNFSELAELAVDTDGTVQNTDCQPVMQYCSIDRDDSTVNSDCSDNDDNISDISDDNESMVSDLRQWALKNNVSHVAIDDLLSILRRHFPELPKDSRTVMQTCSNVQLQAVAGGHYYHFSLVNGLKTVIDKFQVSDSVINLQLNIDGLPLFKSSPGQFWPILGLVTNSKIKQPFIIGLFYGNTKPASAADYLQQFVDEYSNVQHHGLNHNNNHYTIKLSAVVCDMPARTFVKATKGHTGYHGCDKCVQEGVYTNNRMTFPETDTALRTDESFIAQLDEFHHVGVSPFTCLSFGMINAFPIDYMHAVCLGVMRKLLYLWMKGPLHVRLGGHCTQQISNRLLSLKSSVPCEFARKPRSINEVDRWKATEFRQLLLYTGPVCLHGIIPDVIYKNFMLISCGMYILLSQEHCVELCDQAQTVLTNFCHHFGDLYGKEFLSYNVHSVVHLADESRLHGVLDNVSCFVFENYLGKIKKLLRKPNDPLQQVVKRVSEMCTDAPLTQSKRLQKPHHDGPIPSHLNHFQQFREFHQTGFTVSLDEKNSCVLINGKPAIVRNFLQNDDKWMVVYQFFSDIQCFYTYPFPSDRLGIFSVSSNLQELAVAPTSRITRKCCYFKDGLQHIVVPLLH